MKKFLPIIFLLFTCCVCAAPMRGVWIATVQNIDWPSSPNLSAKEQQQELITMLDGLQKLGFNAIFLQVRPSADTFWPSELEPWSRYLGGKNPGYDPLAFALEQTHKRGMQLHAWVNPFRITTDAKIKLPENHPAQKNQDWALTYNGKKFYDPGNPAARAHCIKVIAEIAKKYKVDGIHLDDYFYPYPDDKKTPLDDKASFKKYAKKGQSPGDWRRENINIFIRDLRAAVKAENPKITFGISPFGIWCNAKDCEGGSDTGGLSSNLVLYGDSRAWLQEGLLDYIAPQIYWHRKHKTASFDKLAEWWAAQIKAAPGSPKLYIGIAAYKHTAGDWKDEGELENQVKHARKNKNVHGFIYFSAGKVLSGKRNVAQTVKTLNK